MPISASEVKEEIAFLQEKGEVINLDGTEWTILEGDLALDDLALELYARKRLETRQAADGSGISPEAGRPLMAKVDEAGRFVRWERGLVLSYAVLKHSFLSEAHYDEVVLAMKRATREWQDLCGVRFEYRAELDNEEDPDEVLFVVRYYPLGSQYTIIARAFFPDSPLEDRIVYIFPKWFTTSIDRVGIMRHELGHLLGFRHEHIREEAPYGCPDESLHDAVALGEYDPQSVMHYLCEGLGSETLAFTDLDREGARIVYGAPDSECTFFA